MAIPDLLTNLLPEPAPDFLLESILHERFGLQEFRPKQKEVIDHILGRRHVLALLPTGYGKSLCYQVPSQVLPGITLVVSPLIALMQDQVSGLERRGIKNATFLNSSLSPVEQDIRFAAIKDGQYKLVYVAPERFESPRFRNLLAGISVSLLVIDEAHCISQWGHDFRPHYRSLTRHVEGLGDATVLALTATATAAVQKDIVQLLNLKGMQVVTGSFDRPNIYFSVEHAPNARHKEAAIDRLLSQKQGAVIIYTATRKEAEESAKRLQRLGISSACYHAGLSIEQRQRTQRNFENDRLSVIVSTVAFGMGVDKGNISQVIHYNMPGSLENYYQEAGRAGRSGQPATCTLLYQPKDIYTQRWLLERNYPTQAQVQTVHRLVEGYRGQPVRASDLLPQLKIADSALNSAIDLLKHLQLIDTTPDGALFATGKQTSDHIDMSTVNMRRQRDDNRLERMIGYAQSARCRRQQILDYFGQRLDSCNGCDICHPIIYIAQRPREPLSTEPEAPERRRHSPEAAATKTKLQSKRHEITEPSQDSLSASILQLAQELSGRVGRTTLALILVGSRSKKLKERELDQHELYGKHQSMKDDQVLTVIDNLIANGQLRSINGMYPKVSITSEGSNRLAALKSGD